MFIFDELGFFLYPEHVKVLVKKSTKQLPPLNTNSNEYVTVLLGGNASGEITPPLIALRNDKINDQIKQNIPRSMRLTNTKSGWIKANTFYDYIVRDFLPWIKGKKIPLPVIVFIDGHSSYQSLTLSEFCHKNKIILVYLHPKAIHMLQPMEVGIFGLLKRKWMEEREKWTALNTLNIFRRQDFPVLFKKTLDEMASNRAIFLNAFQACGKIIDIKLQY